MHRSPRRLVFALALCLVTVAARPGHAAHSYEFHGVVTVGAGFPYGLSPGDSVSGQIDLQSPWSPPGLPAAADVVAYSFEFGDVSFVVYPGNDSMLETPGTLQIRHGLCAVEHNLFLEDDGDWQIAHATKGAFCFGPGALTACPGCPPILPAPPAPGLTVALDFEDALRPDARGWIPLVPDWAAGPQNSLIGCAPGPSGGTHDLNLTTSGEGGWYLDLTGVVPPAADWVFSLNVRRGPRSDPGDLDLGIRRVDGSQGAELRLPPAESADGAYHELKMVMDQAAGLVSYFVDGAPQGSAAPSLGAHPLVPSANAILFEFDRSAAFADVYFDDLFFEATLPPVSAGSQVEALGWGRVKARYR